MKFKNCIKNRTCYYFDDMIKIEDFDFDNILLDGRSWENILIYNISYKILIGSKLLRIRFDKVNGFIRAYDGTRYLVLFGTEKYDAIYNTIRYLKNKKNVLHTFLLIIMQKSKSIHMTFYL